MTRRGNVQHGKARSRPWSVIVPSVLLVLLSAVLVWELVVLFAGNG